MNISAVNKIITLLGRIFDTHQPTEAYLPKTADKPAGIFPAEQKLPRVAPETVGVSSVLLEELSAELAADTTLHLHSLLLARNGRVFGEINFGAQDTRTWKYTYSACKSVTSLAVGILMGQGLLRMEDKIVDLFADRIGPVAKLRLASITIRDVLTMRSGIVFGEAEAMVDDDWLKCYLSSAVTGEIGKTFAYNSMNTYLLAVIVTQKSGMTLTAFLKKYLFDAMQITDFYWETCPHGIEKGGWGLYMLPEDMAKLATLILQNGAWEGKNLVPAWYLAQATASQTETPDSCGDYDYGYQMWVKSSPASFLFNGMLGQNIFGYRETGIVAVANAGNEETFQQGNIYGILDRYFGFSGDGLQSQPFPYDEEADHAFKRRLLLLRDHTEAELLAFDEAYAQKCAIPSTSAADVSETDPRSLWTRFWTKCTAKLRPHITPEAQQETSREIPMVPYIQSLPAAHTLFVNRRFVPVEDDGTASMGLLPMINQVIQNNYSRGLCSITLSKQIVGNAEMLVLTYHESDDIFICNVGMWGVACRTQLYFHGEPYLVAASGTFSSDEDGRAVLKIRCDFLETPSTRFLKLYANADGTYLLKQYEQPGTALIYKAVIDQKLVFAAQPVIGPAMEKIDNDYFDYRIKRTFAPEILMKAIEVNAANVQ